MMMRDAICWRARIGPQSTHQMAMTKKLATRNTARSMNAEEFVNDTFTPKNLGLATSITHAPERRLDTGRRCQLSTVCVLRTRSNACADPILVPMCQSAKTWHPKRLSMLHRRTPAGIASRTRKGSAVPRRTHECQKFGAGGRRRRHRWFWLTVERANDRGQPGVVEIG